MSAALPVIIVGIVPDQSPLVVETAVAFAARMAAGLLCVHVDESRFVTGRSPDGSEQSEPLDPDVVDEGPSPFPADLQAKLAAVIETAGIMWWTRQLSGETADALARVADDADAIAIVVGTRRHGARGAVSEFLNGSVAVHLARRQGRPILVIPQTPVTSGALPWEIDR